VVVVVVIITLEDINIRIKAEDNIFCFYLISYFRFMIQRRNFWYTEKTKNHFTFKFC